VRTVGSQCRHDSKHEARPAAGNVRRWDRDIPGSNNGRISSVLEKAFVWSIVAPWA
jgi:hypothetical protein